MTGEEKLSRKDAKAQSFATKKVSPPEAYRLWAATYDDEPNPILCLVDRNLKIPGGLVIDVACGTGRRGGIGVDLSMEMVARSSGPAAQADARQLPFAGG